MKILIQKWVGVIKARPFIAGAVLLFILAIAGWFTFGGNGVSVETITVAKGEFKQQVSVSGKVSAIQDVELGFSQGGRIARIYTKVGSEVSSGTLLAETENNDLKATLLQKQAALEKAQAQLTALKEGARPEELAVQEAAVVNARAVLLEALRGAYRISDDAIHNQVDQFYSNPRTAPQLNFTMTDSQLQINLATERSTFETELDVWQKALNTASPDISALTAQSQKTLGSIADFLSMSNVALNKAISNTVVTESMIDDYTTDIATARSAVNTSAITIANAVSSLSAAEKNLALKQAGTRSTDIVVQRAEIKSIEADVLAARAQLAKTRITAPFTGLVTRIDAKAGEIAPNGTAMVAMIQGGTFQIESYIPEVEISAVEVGDVAEIHLDAYGSSMPFEAVVVAIDPAETLREGVSAYKTTLQFSAPDARTRSGMTADIAITVERKENVIAVPSGAIYSRDGVSYAKVRVDDDVVEKTIATGLTSLGTVEIVSGISEGDAVVLNP